MSKRYLVRLSDEERQELQDLVSTGKAALLDWHLLFTGRCPHCEVPLLQTEPSRIDWDCACGWRDDTV